MGGGNVYPGLPIYPEEPGPLTDFLGSQGSAEARAEREERRKDQHFQPGHQQREDQVQQVLQVLDGVAGAVEGGVCNTSNFNLALS